MLKNACVILTALLLPACAHWPFARTSHPDVGKIWSVAAGRYVSEAEVIDELAKARFVLLGENHDNAVHHELQAKVIRSLTSRGKQPTVAFEQLNTDQQRNLDHHLANRPGDALGIGEAVNWQGSGWPPWEIYQPIAEAALAAKLPIAVTLFPNRRVPEIYRDGLDAVFPPKEAARLGLDQTLPKSVEDQLEKEIQESHCGQLPVHMIPAMVLVQRARDAQMAASLAKAGEAHGAVLIAGNGHIRKDWGVPTYLAHIAPNAKVASLAFAEIAADGNVDELKAEAQNSVDFLWLTNPQPREDLCEKLKLRIQKIGSPKAETNK